MSQADERTYRVVGMSCGHCRAAVTEEVGRLEGVSGVEVDLESGLVTVRGTAIDDASVASAVEEAGYEVAS
jgi:copper chaperone